MKQRYFLQFILGILFSSFFIVACDSTDLFDTSTCIQKIEKSTKSISEQDSTFENLISVIAIAHNGYIYNTQDRQDYCHVYLDGAEYPAYPNITVPLENEKYVDIWHKMSYGKHHVKLVIMIDEGVRYSYQKCTILVTSEITALGEEFYYNTVDLDEDHTPTTTAGFVAEFDVDYPYLEENNYALSINLDFK